MTNLTKIDFSRSLWENNGFKTRTAPAPKDAQTFDQMLIVFADENEKIIRRVMFFSVKDNKIIAEF